jgi:uncharacterized protein (UPF0332 family)
MPRLNYKPAQKRRAGTLLSLALSEAQAAGHLIHVGNYRESVVHLYFSSFYISQSLLIDRLKGDAHKTVDAQIHKSFKDRGIPAQVYTRLHSSLHQLRTRINYRDTEIPNPDELRRLYASLQRYFRHARRIVPTTQLTDILEALREEREEIVEVSYEVYVPVEYGYGGAPLRLTVWVPGEEIGSLQPRRLAARAQEFLESIGASGDERYVVGINSRVSQSEAVHLILLDLDTTDPSVESALKPIGGYLFRSGRGFHFIGREPVHGERQWQSRLRRIAKSRALRAHVDQDHITLSVSRGYATLRLTTNADKPDAPLFYKEL